MKESSKESGVGPVDAVFKNGIAPTYGTECDDDSRVKLQFIAKCYHLGDSLTSVMNDYTKTD